MCATTLKCNCRGKREGGRASSTHRLVVNSRVGEGSKGKKKKSNRPSPTHSAQSCAHLSTFERIIYLFNLNRDSVKRVNVAWDSITNRWMASKATVYDNSKTPSPDTSSDLFHSSFDVRLGQQLCVVAAAAFLPSNPSFVMDSDLSNQSLKYTIFINLRRVKKCGIDQFFKFLWEWAWHNPDNTDGFLLG